MNSHTVRKYLLVVLVILGVILVYLCVLLVRQYQTVRTLPMTHSTFQLRHREQKPLTAQDVTAITPWMTFDFINRVFSLPADFLKNALQITDARYPNISLQEYARAHQIDLPAFLGTIQSQVARYLGASGSLNAISPNQ